MKWKSLSGTVDNICIDPALLFHVRWTTLQAVTPCVMVRGKNVSKTMSTLLSGLRNIGSCAGSVLDDAASKTRVRWMQSWSIKETKLGSI